MPRESTMHPIYEKLLELAAPYLNTRLNDVHTREVLRVAEPLLQEIDAREDVVVPALILHDVGWKMVPEDLQLKAFGPRPFDASLQRIHEVEGARLAREILDLVDYDRTKADQIVQIVEGHDSRAEALSIEDMVVKDCDKLTRFRQAAFDMVRERFEYPAAEYVIWLEQHIDRWFFTETAGRLAREELEKRRGEVTLDPR